MTVGIGAQRTVRNQVICSTALGYNQYTLMNLDRSVGDYAKERNTDAWVQNLAELQRVDQYNALFCKGYIAYQTRPIEVRLKGPNKTWIHFDSNAINAAKLQSDRIIPYYTYSVADTDIAEYKTHWNNHDSNVSCTPGTDLSINTGGMRNLFDGSEGVQIINGSETKLFTYWSPNSTACQDIIFDFYLPKIHLTRDGDWTWWDINQITLNFRFVYDNRNQPAKNTTPIEYEIWINDTGVWKEIANKQYQPQVAGLNAKQRQTDLSAKRITTISNETNTPHIQIIFKDVFRWGTEYFLNNISILGHSPESLFICPEVKYRFWAFDASPTNNITRGPEVLPSPTPENPHAHTYYDDEGTYIALCPLITPIHGLMYRGFVRSWLNEQLIIGHEPFILAIRNIALSPFYIA
eukprot:200059_1